MRSSRRAKRNSARRSGMNSRRNIKAHRRRTTNHSRYSHEMPAEIRQSPETAPPVDVPKVYDQIFLIQRLILEVFGGEVNETLNEVVCRIWGQYLWTPTHDQFAEEVAQVIAEIKHGVPVKKNYCKEELRSELYCRDETITTLRYQKRQLEDHIDHLKTFKTKAELHQRLISQ